MNNSVKCYLCGTLVLSIIGVESLPLLCKKCEHSARLPEHTHQEQQSGLTYNSTFSYASVSGATGSTSASVTKPLTYTIKSNTS